MAGSSAEKAKLNQELLVYGYLRENVNISFDAFPKTLIPIFINFINCILDLVYDRTINHEKYTWYSDKKIELKHFKDDTGKGAIAVIDRVFNKELCRNFRIDFRITFAKEESTTSDDNDPFAMMLNFQRIIPEFRVGYLTELDEEMRENLNGDMVCYERLGHRFLGDSTTYGIGIDRSGIAMYQPGTARKEHDRKERKFAEELREEDVISLFYSFETNESAIYHNDKRIGDCFKHESQDIVNIYPAISMYSRKHEAFVARVEVIHGILNIQE